MTGTYVIAIAGYSGAGKSTLIENLVLRLGHANELSLDSYRSTSVYPEAARWIEDGADPNAFKMPRLRRGCLRTQEWQIHNHPESGVEIQPRPYLLLEEHFGRGRDAIRELIDFVVYLDTPLEVAYIRKLARKTDFLPWEDDPPVFIEHLRENMEWYQRVGRRFYLAVGESVRKDCELLVNGLLPNEEIADQVMEALHGKI